MEDKTLVRTQSSEETEGRTGWTIDRTDSRIFPENRINSIAITFIDCLLDHSIAQLDENQKDVIRIPREEGDR